MRLILILLIPTILAAGFARADEPILEFGTCYAAEPGRLEHPQSSEPGAVLTVVGEIVDAHGPLAGIAPFGSEITIVMDGLDATGGQIFEDFVCIWGTDTYYGPGVLRIYVDESRDADPSDPGTYRDGELILVGTLTDFFLRFWSHCVWGQNGGQSATVTWTGGTELDRVSTDGVGETWYMGSLFSIDSEYVTDTLQGLGYFATLNGGLWLDFPATYPYFVPVEPVTWSGIKRRFGER